MNKFCGVGQGNEWEVSGSDKAETEDRRDSNSLTLREEVKTNVTRILMW